MLKLNFVGHLFWQLITNGMSLFGIFSTIGKTSKALRVLGGFQILLLVKNAVNSAFAGSPRIVSDDSSL